jgi:hypothetical protein
MTRRTLLRTIAVSIVASADVEAADLQDQTRRAYDEYLDRAMRLFVDRARHGTVTSGVPGNAQASHDRDVSVGPAREDGILPVPGGLVHHWLGSTFIAGVTMDDALAVSYNYNDYRSIYKPVIASSLLGRDGNNFRVRMRVKESGGGLSATLDVTSRVEYAYPDDRSAYSIATSDDIREIRDAGTASERSLAPGHDSGYLWRAATFNYLGARNGGVFAETEAVALSRRFPPFLAWIIEPAARRLGRNSVERSMVDFAQAVKMRARAR